MNDEPFPNPPALPNPPAGVEFSDLSLGHGAVQVLRGISLRVPERRITALIGPSDCGKSTLLRCVNRMVDLVDDLRFSGRCLVGGVDVRDPALDVGELRRTVGLVPGDPGRWPGSIFDHVALGLKIAGCTGSELGDRVALALRRAALWHEVNDRLTEPAQDLPPGLYRRLTLARALAVGPEVLLLDDPTLGLDPVEAASLEDLIRDLRQDHTILLTTHHLYLAARISDRTAFLDRGELLETDETGRLFSRPRDPRTERFITGRRD